MSYFKINETTPICKCGSDDYTIRRDLYQYYHDKSGAMLQFYCWFNECLDCFRIFFDEQQKEQRRLAIIKSYKEYKEQHRLNKGKRLEFLASKPVIKATRYKQKSKL